MLIRFALLVSLAFAGCDSGVEFPPPFGALEGTWEAQDGRAPVYILFGPQGRYELSDGAEVTERGQFSISLDGAASDPDALEALRSIQLNADPSGDDFTYLTVVSASARVLELQECISNCDGVEIRAYRRPPQPVY